MKNLKKNKTIFYGSRLNISFKLKKKSKFMTSAFGFFAPLQNKPLFSFIRPPLFKTSRILTKQRKRPFLSTFVPFAYDYRAQTLYKKPTWRKRKGLVPFCKIINEKRKKNQVLYSTKISKSLSKDLCFFHKSYLSSSYPFLISVFIKNNSGKRKPELCGFQTLALKNQKTLSSPFAENSQNYWKKRITAAYFLLIAYKQTARAKWKHYLNSSTNTQLFLALSPFFIYLIQTSLERYDIHFQADSFIQRSLPQWNVGIPSQKLTWETFVYTKYSNKINPPSIKEMIGFENSLFISLNPIWQLEQKQLYLRPMDISNELQTPNHTFISSRYFFQLHSLISKKKWFLNKLPPDFCSISGKQIFDKNMAKLPIFDLPHKKTDLKPFSLLDNLNTKWKLNRDWQFFFDEFDDIPMKLSSVFHEPPSWLESSESTGQPLLSFTDEDDPLNPKSVFSKKIVVNPFEIQNTKLSICSTNPSSENTSPLLFSETFPSSPDNSPTFQNSLSPLKKTWIDLLNETFFEGFQKNESQNPLFFERTVHYNIDFGLSTFAKFPKILTLQPITLKSLPPETLTIEKAENSISIDMGKKPKRVDTKKDIISMEVKKDVYSPFYNKKKNKEGWFFDSFITDAFLDWKKVIREDLKKPSPFWSKYLKKAPTTELVKLENFEELFFKQLKSRFPDSLIDSIQEDPESILSLFKKTMVAKAQTPPETKDNSLAVNQLNKTEDNFFFQKENFLKPFSQEQKTKEGLNFEKTKGYKDLYEPFLMQRKLSGYLYPDSSRQNSSLGSKNLELHQLLKNNERTLNLSQTKEPVNFLKKEKPFIFQAPKLNPKTLKKSKNFYSRSLIQIEQPLLPFISNDKIDKVDFKTQPLSNLKLQKKTSQNFIPPKNILNYISINPLKLNFLSKNLEHRNLGEGESLFFQIKPDSSLTSNQDFFFAEPTKRLVYKAQPVNKTTVPLSISKLEQKIPYVRFSEQIIRVTELPEENLALPTSEIFKNVDLNNNVNSLLYQKPFLVKSQRERFATEARKEKVFSVVLKEKNFNPFFFKQKPLERKNFQGLREKTLDWISSPLAYKSRFHSTKPKNVQSLLFFEKLPPRISSFHNPLFKGKSSLYEPLSLKSWSVLSKLGFLYLLLKGLSLLKDEYAEEWNYYLKDADGLRSEIEENLLEIPTQSENFRVIEKTRKKFSDLVGGRVLLNEFGDIILWLRNSQKHFCQIQMAQPKPIQNKTSNQKDSLLFNANGFKIETLTSRGILLIGPPGTGKTLLVQALSGEANVPIIIESGKKLNSNLEIPGVERLKDLFKKARTMSPCLLFLDEIDTIGQKRPHVIAALNSLDKQMEIPNILNLLYFQNPSNATFVETKGNQIDHTRLTSFSKSSWNRFNPVLQFQIKSTSTKKLNQNQISDEQPLKDFKIQISDEKRVGGENQERDLIMLTQLLCELDGLNQRKKVMVIGATNRPATLDSALIRPGRLGKILYLDLPGKQKRFDLLKFYSHLGVLEGSINWDYFANQTVGLSAAHLSAAMNRSALKTIYSFLYRKKNQPTFVATLNKMVKRSSVEKKFSNLLTKPFRDTSSSKNLFSKKKRNKKQKPSLKNFFFSLKILKTTWHHTKSKFLFFLLQTKPINVANKNVILSKQKKPLHTFETIEYGIQTVSTINTHSQLSFVKGKLTNKKTFGHMFPLFLAHSVKENKKRILNLKKLDSIYHTIFNRESFLSSVNRSETKLFKKNLGALAFLVNPFGFSFGAELPNRKSKLNSTKKSFEKRKHFYEKQRLYLRSLALLENRNTNGKKNRFIKKKLKISKRGFSLKKCQLLDRYLSRITENQLFGWFLLLNSTCVIYNAFFLTSFQLKFWSLQTKKPNLVKIEKKKNFLYYNILALASVDSFAFGLNNDLKKKSFLFSKNPVYNTPKSKTGSSTKTLLMWQNNHFKNQINLFGDALFLNRSAYYLSGKSIVNLTSILTNKFDQPISLWSFLTSPQVRQKKKTYDYLNKNRMAFENVLLALMAGKASESLMLKNQIGVLKQNNSDIGLHELKDLSILLPLMMDQYFFYSEKGLTRKQVNQNFLANTLQIQQKDHSFLHKLTTLFENSDTNNKLLTNLNSPFYDEFKLGETPWWQLKSSQLLTVTNVKYSEWYRLFLMNPAQNLRNIEWSSPDSFYHNQVNNRFLLSNKRNLSNFDLEKELNPFFINREMVLNYIVFNHLNWNQLPLLELEFLTTSFIFESFNKTFDLLESHRELLDSFVYSLFCQEKIKEFEMKNFYEHYRN